MGSLNAPPRQPTAPQTARANGISPSLPALWPSALYTPALRAVRLLAAGTLPLLVFGLLRRQAGTPGPALLIGGLVNSANGFVPAPMEMFAALAAATVLTVFVVSTRFKMEASR
jgi:hypothetical protein